MDIAYFPKALAANAPPVIEAMCAALRDRGHRMVTDTKDADAAMIWSMLWAGRMSANQAMYHHYRQHHRPVLILEIGCLRRGFTWKIGVNSTLPRQCLAAARGPGRKTVLNMDVEPWRQKRGRDIVICLQRTQSHHWSQMPTQDQWIAELVSTVRQHTDRPIKIRPHPRQKFTGLLPAGCSIMVPQHRADTYDDFDFHTATDSAWCVINHNSHPGVQSVIAGVPVFVDQTSLASPVANLDLRKIESPEMPDRTAWFDDLVWTEFTLDEIRRGMPLDLLDLS